MKTIKCPLTEKLITTNKSCKKHPYYYSMKEEYISNKIYYKYNRGDRGIRIDPNLGYRYCMYEESQNISRLNKLINDELVLINNKLDEITKYDSKNENITKIKINDMLIKYIINNDNIRCIKELIMTFDLGNIVNNELNLINEKLYIKVIDINKVFGLDYIRQLNHYGKSSCPHENRGWRKRIEKNRRRKDRRDRKKYTKDSIKEI